MKPVTAQELWQQLSSQSLVQGEMPALSAAASPWYVRVMLGVAGWIGALFLLGFVGAGFAFIAKNSGAFLTLGVLACGAAYLIFRTARDNDFATQFGLAVSLTGQVLFFIGLFDQFKGDRATLYFVAFAFEAGLALLVPNFIHRVLTSWGAMIALAFALSRIGVHGLAAGIAAAGFAAIWLDARRWALHASSLRPIAYGLVLALVQLTSFQFFGHELRSVFYGQSHASAFLAPWVGTLLVAAVFVWAVTALLARENIAIFSKAGMAAIFAALLVAALSFAAPGMATALLILLLGFASGNRVLMGLGLFALGGFVSHYYYQLQTTLLMKSMLLAATGTLLLSARLMLRKTFSVTSQEEQTHA